MTYFCPSGFRLFCRLRACGIQTQFHNLNILNMSEFSLENYYNGAAELPVDIVLEILHFCVPVDCAAFVMSNRHYASMLQLRDFWKAMCRDLEFTYFVHAPLHPWRGSWREQFLYLYGCRHRFAGVDQASDRTTIHVAARFRPAVVPDWSEGEEDADQPSAVVIPLHQRLQMIKAAHGCSSAEARRILWSGTATSGDSAPDPWAQAKIATPTATATSEQPVAESDGLPPQSLHELGTHKAGVLAVGGDRVLLCAPSAGLKQFK